MKSTLLLSVVALLSMAENVMTLPWDRVQLDNSIKPHPCFICHQINPALTCFENSNGEMVQCGGDYPGVIRCSLKGDTCLVSDPVKPNPCFECHQINPALTCFANSDGELVQCGGDYPGAIRCTEKKEGNTCIVPSSVDPSSVVPTPVDPTPVVPVPKSCAECKKQNPKNTCFVSDGKPGKVVQCGGHYPGAFMCTKAAYGNTCLVPDPVDSSSVDSSSVVPTSVDPSSVVPTPVEPKSCAECAKEDFCLLDIQNGDFVQCGPCEDCYCTEIACSDGGNSCNTCWNIRSLPQNPPYFKPKGLPSFLRKGKVPKDELLK